MSFVNDYEDVNSLALTATKILLERNNIHESKIGKLEVWCKATRIEVLKSIDKFNIRLVLTIVI